MGLLWSVDAQNGAKTSESEYMFNRAHHVFDVALSRIKHRASWERTCPRMRHISRRILIGCTGLFAAKSAPTKTFIQVLTRLRRQTESRSQMSDCLHLCVGTIGVISDSPYYLRKTHACFIRVA